VVKVGRCLGEKNYRGERVKRHAREKLAAEADVLPYSSVAPCLVVLTTVLLSTSAFSSPPLRLRTVVSQDRAAHQAADLISGAIYKKDSPEPPRLSSKPSRLEGQIDDSYGTGEMLQTDCRMMNI
jgi:hypothetical protein